MPEAIYNRAIPIGLLNSGIRRRACRLRLAASFFFFFISFEAAVFAVDWSVPEQQLAAKIVAVSGAGPVALTFRNHSTLGRRDSEIIQNGLRSALRTVGVQIASTEHVTTTIDISLSENLHSYVWVAEIRKGDDSSVVVMVSMPRLAGTNDSHDAMPVSIRKSRLWTQFDPVLDVAILEEDGAPSRIAVLDSKRVTIYRVQIDKWREEQAAEVSHSRPWPRDLRGRLIHSKDTLDVYLPGVVCHGTMGKAFSLNCRDSEDPWPLIPPSLSGTSALRIPNATTNVAPQSAAAFFVPSRNFFSGMLNEGIGTTLPKFYSAAFWPRERGTLWLLVDTNGQIHMIDGMDDQLVNVAWGSSLTTLKSGCGAGWQVLATSPEKAAADSVRAYEFPDRDPVAVSTAVNFPGTISALWTETKGDTAIAVSKNPDTGDYEAYRLAMACDQ